MAHMIGNRDIQVGTEQAWHGLTHIKEKITLKEECEINYPMTMIPLVYGIRVTDPVTQIQTDQTIETPFRQIVSLDDNLPIGNPVSEKYCLLSNEMILNMIGDALLGTQHTIASLGSVCDRAKAFVSIKLTDNIVAAGREHETHLNVTWGHGGIMSLIANSGNTCIVCQNTLTMSLSRKGEFNMQIKHTKNAGDKLIGMSEAIDRHIGVTKEFQLAMDEMDSIKCDQEDARKITAGIITPETFERDTKVSTRTINMVNRIAELATSGRGNKGETLADLFNGATDYFTHESSGSGKDPWKQFVSSEFGSASQSKREWFTTLVDSDATSKARKRGEQILLVA